MTQIEPELLPVFGGRLQANAVTESALARERLRRRYRPTHVRLLFVGEAPPASGRFFYQADSGLYRAMRGAFVAALPDLGDADFLESFRALSCYLVDLCGRPVDRLDAAQRKQAHTEGEVRLGGIIRQLQPEVVITVVRSIAPNVVRAQQLSNWMGAHLVLPYPGRWKHHRASFDRLLIPVLRKELAKEL
jgi:hypothetical protein